MILPLHDKIFISTRPENSQDELPQLLTEAGATVLHWPMIKIKGSGLSEVDKKEISDIQDYQWIIFTSANGVKYFFENLKQIKQSEKLPGNLRIAVIGEKTKKEVREYGYTPSFVNPGNTAEEFAEPFARLVESEDKRPKIMLALGKLARTVIQNRLSGIADCVRINVYETVPPEQTDFIMMQRINKGLYDMIIFTSPSGIENFIKVAPGGQNKDVRIACIGEVTARAARENGLQPLVVAQKSTASGIAGSIINYYISKNK